jgi:heptosyltransferase-2
MSTSFATIDPSQLRTDCRFYSGYKPCHRFDGCPECPHYKPRGVQILIIKLGAMGDVLRTKVILDPLKARFPESWIVWLTDPGSEPLVRDPQVDEIRAYTAAGIGALEGRRFHQILCLDKDPHAVSLSARLPADRRLGFAPTAYNTISIWNDASLYALRLGLSDPLKFYQNTKTVPQIVSEMAEVECPAEPYRLAVSEEARRQARKVLTGLLGSDPTGPIIGLNTGCGPVFATKGWTHERMGDFLRLLPRHPTWRIVLLGGVRERAIHEYLRAAAGPLLGKQVFDSGNDHSLETFFGLVEQSDLLLSADSLAMHVGIALRRKVVAWFGPTCHQEVDLYGRGEKVVTDFACSPCYLKTCPKDVFCMDALAGETVLAAVERVLAQ